MNFHLKQEVNKLNGLTSEIYNQFKEMKSQQAVVTSLVSTEVAGNKEMVRILSQDVRQFQDLNETFIERLNFLEDHLSSYMEKGKKLEKEKRSFETRLKESLENVTLKESLIREYKNQIQDLLESQEGNILGSLEDRNKMQHTSRMSNSKLKMRSKRRFK